jgi:UDP-glucose:(heptosyl)LPS alpha-1,3-glucosyltransferase
VIERFVPGAGGVENVAWQVAHALAGAGEDVTVLAREISSQAEVQTQRLPVSRFWQPLRVLAFSRAAARATGLAGGSGPRAFDLVHSFSRTRFQDLYRAGGGSHDDFLRRTHPGLRHLARRLSPRHRTLLGIEARVFADPSQRIQCASRFVADTLTERHGVAPERILLLPNGVDLDRFARANHLTAGAQLRQELSPNAEQVWLFPASGWPRKGLPELLEALARLHDPGLELWIAGRDDPAPWRERAARLGIEKALHFLGNRADPETLYAAADGMILPTRYDAFANVTLEAAAAGLPVITTSSNGAAEWLAPDLTLIDEAGDAFLIADALASLADPAERKIRGARLAERAKAFGWDVHIDALREEYASIIARRPES